MNDRRAETAGIALRAVRGVPPYDDLQTQVTDLLANPRHLCRVEGIDFLAWYVMSEFHFEAEAQENENRN